MIYFYNHQLIRQANEFYLVFKITFVYHFFLLDFNSLVSVQETWTEKDIPITFYLFPLMETLPPPK